MRIETLNYAILYGTKGSLSRIKVSHYLNQDIKDYLTHFIFLISVVIFVQYAHAHLFDGENVKTIIRVSPINQTNFESFKVWFKRHTSVEFN